MNLHEHQAKALLRSYGIPVPKGDVAATGDEAQAIAEAGGGPWAVKAQIHAGGRGKAGGIKIAKTVEEVVQFTNQLLGTTLVTPQTGPAGKPVNTVYIEEVIPAAQELYISLLIDRATGWPTFLMCEEGGMDIEAHPEKVTRVPVDPATGFCPFHARKLGLPIGEALYKAFIECDAQLIEINPLVRTAHELLALDAKITLDENALYRHPDLVALRDSTQEDPADTEAAQQALSYIRLQGNIGCLVNGAGLAMATMDLLKFYGGEPANFLDVGGNATQERVAAAFKIILSDPNVHGILVNIFGGIMRCDIIAEGIIAAVKEGGISLPLVVRLQGTRSEEGMQIFKNSGLPIFTEESFAGACQRIVEEVK